MKPQVHNGIGSGWVTFMKTLSFIFAGAITILGAVIGYNMMDTWFVGALIGLAVGLLSITSIMVLLNAAENIEQTTTNSAAIFLQMKAVTANLEQIQLRISQLEKERNP